MSRPKTTIHFLLLIFLLGFTSLSLQASCDEAEENQCATGEVWDCGFGKCVADDTTQTMSDVTDQCSGIEDEAERQSCFDSVAKGAVSEDGFANENFSEDAAKSAEMLGWANLIWGALIGEMNTTCYSTQIMKWTGYAQTAGELYQYFVLADKVADLQEEYEKRNTSDNSYDAQYDAFEYLVQEQETIADVSKQKKLIYTVAAAGYTAAAGAAIIESAMTLAGSSPECFTKANQMGAPLSCAAVVGKSPETAEEQKNAKDQQASDAQEKAANDNVENSSEVKQAKKLVTKQQENVDTANTNIKKTEALIAENKTITDTDMASRAELTMLEDKLAGQKADLVVETKKLEGLNTDLEGVRNTNFNSQMGNARSDVEAKAAAVTNHESNVKAQEAKIADAQTKIEKAETKTELNAAKVELSEAQTEMKKLGTLSDRKADLLTSQQELNAYEVVGAQSKYDLATQDKTLTSQINENQLAKDEATRAFEQNKQAQDFENTMDTNEQKIAKYDDIINNKNSTKAEIDAATVGKVGATADFDLAKGQLGKLKAGTEIPTLQGEIKQLDGSLNSAGNAGVDLSFSDQVRYNVNDPNIDMSTQVGNIWGDAWKNLSIQSVSSSANETLMKLNIKSSKDNFNKLPSKTQSSLTYDLKLAVNKAESLEMNILNNVAPSDYLNKANELMNTWKDIANKASSIGDTEAAENAANMANKWEQIIKSRGSYNFTESETLEVYSLFTKKTYNFKKLHTLNILLGDIKHAESDLDAYIAFRDWQRFNVGKLNSLSITQYNQFLSVAPKNVYPHSAMRDALYQVVKYRIQTNNAYAGDVGGKIGGLAKGMAIGALKTYALKFAMCTLAPTVAESVSTALQTPYATAVMASATAYVNFQLRDVAVKEEKQAKKNAEIVRAVMAKFKESQIINCPDGRDDESNPTCYCYSADGTESNHSNSDICKELWAADNKDWFKPSGDYGNDGSGGCVFLNGQYDLECKCKNLVDSGTGSTACMKNPVTAQSGLMKMSFPQFQTSAGTIGEIVASAASGNLSNGNLSEGTIGNAAKAQKKLNEQMVKKVNKALAKNGVKAIDLNSEAARAYIRKKALPSSAQSRLSAAIAQDNASGRAAMSGDAKTALDSAMKSSGVKYSKDSSTGAAGQTKSAFNFASGDSSSKRGSKSLKFMKKKYNYKNNDINTNKGASIFEMISNRYSKSGLRRVFGDE